MDYKETLAKIAEILIQGDAFILTTHRDPDVDGIGSMLAIGEALRQSGKRVNLVLEEPVPQPFDLLAGAHEIGQTISSEVSDCSAVILLDCADEQRLGIMAKNLSNMRPWINIDHHETNTGFGNINLVDPKSSSTGELVYRVIRETGLPIDLAVAENLFAAIQTDTGSFRYDNTTSASMRIAADMIDLGVDPWKVTKKVMDGHDLSRLRLLQLALGTVQLHHGGKIATIVLTKEMFDQARANKEDSERFVDFVRFIRGVEIAALIRQTGDGTYKFSLRSNNQVNVARLALKFGGGGHERAAGFDCKGSLDELKESFIREAGRLLNGRA